MYKKRKQTQRNNRNLTEDGREMYKTVPDGKELWVNTSWRERAKHAGPNTSSPDRQTWMHITGFVLSLLTHPHAIPHNFSMEH